MLFNRPLLCQVCRMNNLQVFDYQHGLIMDTSAADIIFDAQGHCNYCTEFTKKLAMIDGKLAKQSNAKDDFIKNIKAKGVGKNYDCIVGVSGGVDSSYVL